MSIRFIYVYREKVTGKAVYVGSSFDVAGRDRQHSNRYEVPFDKEIARRGREAFTLEIVEAFWGNEKDSVSRENQWMNVLETFRTEGCFNFARAFVKYDSEEHHAAWRASLKAAQARPGVRAHLSAVTKKRFEDAEVLAAVSLHWKKYHANPEVRARASARMKKYYEDAEVRARVSTAQKEYWQNLEARALRTAAMKIACRTLNSRARKSETMKKCYENPEARARQSAAQKVARGTPEARAQVSAQMVREHRIRKLAGVQPVLPYPLVWRERYLGLPL